MARPFSEIPLVDVSFLDAAFARGDLSRVMARLAEEHGPIFRWIASSDDEAGQMRLSMIGPEANRFVMNTNRQAFSHEIGWSPLINDTLGKGLLTMDDPEHAIHRRMWNPAFAASYMGTYLPIMQKVVEDRTAAWLEMGEIDLYDESRRVTFDIAAAALSGFSTGEQVDNLRMLFQSLLHGFNQDENLSFEEFVEKFYAARDNLMNLLIRMVQARRAAPPEERPRDVLSLIIHARDDEGNELTDEQVLGHLNILLVAGHETTTTLSAWALYLLSTMPEHRDRILAEMDAAGAGGEPTIDTIRQLKHLDNFVRETGRMYPPVVNVPRGVTQDVEFVGYTIPAGTIVRLGLGACHYMPSVWTHPNEFDPDRLASPREEDKRTPYSLVTFGGGARVCIGQHFALVETKALIAHVLRNYKMEPVSSKKPVHAGFFNSFIPGGIRMKVSSAK